MRLAIVVLIAVVIVSGCDSAEPDRLAQNVFVKAESVTFVEITEVMGGRTVAVFDYIGSVPAPCYKFSGYGGRGTPGRTEVTVEARATSESCSGRSGTIRVERLELASFASGPETITYAFDRRERPPIEIEVTFP